MSFTALCICHNADHLAMFTSCDKALEEFSLNVEPDSGPDTNTEVTITVTRDSENGKVTASKDVNGIRQDTTVIVPLGGVNFEISPLDTIKVNKPEVSSVSFAETGSNSGNWEAERRVLYQDGQDLSS